MTTLNTLFKDSAYKLTQFSPAQIAAIENRIIEKNTNGKITPYVVCLVRGKEIKQVVRQLYLMVLIEDLGYPINRIQLEYGVTFGSDSDSKRADICIFDKDRPTTAYILVELKKPNGKAGKEQLKSYCNATGAPIGIWSNGDSISFYQRKDPSYFEDIPRIPRASEKLSDTYKKTYLKTEVLLNRREFFTIEKLSISVQNFGAYSLCNFIDFREEGIPFLMTKNIRENYIDWNIEKYVTQESHEMLYKSHCHRGQVLITMTGEYLGRVAVYDKDEIVSLNQAIAKVTLKNGINAYLVSTFLNSIHGQNKIQRFKTITGQPIVKIYFSSKVRDGNSNQNRPISSTKFRLEKRKRKIIRHSKTGG